MKQISPNAYAMRYTNRLAWEEKYIVEFYLYPTVGTVLIHSVKPELTE